MCHREARAGKNAGEPPRVHHTGDLEQLVRVLGAACSRGEHEVIARAFALGAQPARRHPGKRVEPICRAGDLCEQMGQAIPALYVRKLVEQYHAKTVHRPRVGIRGHEDRRPQHAPCHRH